MAGSLTDSYRALCSDSYVNQKLSVKLDLPDNREAVLELFERVRKGFADMQSFQRYRDELALESPTTATPHRWVAIRSNNIRSGVVNPDHFDEATGLHRLVLESAPYFLSISPLDIEYLELLYGFDLATAGSHDRLVASALLGDSPLLGLTDIGGARTIDFQPLIGVELDGLSAGAYPGIRSDSRLEAHFEVKTRGAKRSADEQPISVYVTLRLYEPVADLKHLPAALSAVQEVGERLVTERAVPALLVPLRDAIAAEGLGDAFGDGLHDDGDGL